MGAEETSTETGTETSSTETTETGTGSNDAASLRAEAEKWKALARKHEDRNKELLPKVKKFEEYEAANRTDHEKALVEVKSAARTEALTEAGTRLVHAEIKAAASGKIDLEKVKALLDFVDAKRFLNEDLLPDEKKIEAFIKANEPKNVSTNAGSGPDMGQGRRANGNATGTSAGAAEYAAKKAQKSGHGITAAN